VRTFWCSDDDEDRAEGLEEAANAIRNGRSVVLPTEPSTAWPPTRSTGAVRRLLRAKGRGRDMPPPVLGRLPRRRSTRCASKVTPLGPRAVEELWPGPLTLVCRQQPALDVGPRRRPRPPSPCACPPTSCARLIRPPGRLAVCSATAAGCPPRRRVEALEMLAIRSRLLSTTARPGGTASTILDVTCATPRVCAEGGISLAPAGVRPIVAVAPMTAGRGAVREYLLSSRSRGVTYWSRRAPRGGERDREPSPAYRDATARRPIPYFGGVAILAGLAPRNVVALQLPFLSRSGELVFHDARAVLLAGAVICVIG
jgi:tRNA A37 threonylcarbamoyladenosine synthetase subunit TsaC/SUA5/YrdC